MFDELFSYDPNSVSQEIRSQMIRILKARGEHQRYSAEVSELRARAWAGEDGLTGITELKAADLAALRADYIALVLPFLKASVDVEKLMDLLPALGMAILQTLNVPLPVIMEAAGGDFDNFKMLAEQLKELINEHL